MNPILLEGFLFFLMHLTIEDELQLNSQNFQAEK
jgi:hypothetical protein